MFRKHETGRERLGQIVITISVLFYEKKNFVRNSDNYANNGSIGFFLESYIGTE